MPAGTRIVLASPSPPARDAMATICQRLQADFLACDGHAALAAMPLRPHADVVLVDDRDPDHDAAIAAAIAPGPNGRRPVFLLTTYQDLPSTTARCKSHLYAGYLTKPPALREVAIKLTGLLLPPVAGVPAPVAPDAAVAQPTQLRILVAEDNAVNQKLIERILARDGHLVTMAENGRTCCDLFTHGAFDIVLMDMQMPEMSGLEATTQIRRDEQRTGTHVPIVALTANTSIEDRRSCLEAGMDEVLAKPVSIPRLRDLLAHYSRRDPDPGTTNPPAAAQEP